MKRNRIAEKIVKNFMMKYGYMYNDRFIKHSSPYYGKNADDDMVDACEFRLQYDDESDTIFELCALFNDVNVNFAKYWIEAYANKLNLHCIDYVIEPVNEHWFYVRGKLDSHEFSTFSKQVLCA